MTGVYITTDCNPAGEAVLLPCTQKSICTHVREMVPVNGSPGQVTDCGPAWIGWKALLYCVHVSLWPTGSKHHDLPTSCPRISPTWMWDTVRNATTLHLYR